MYFDQHSDIKPMPTNGTRLSLIGNS